MPVRRRDRIAAAGVARPRAPPSCHPKVQVAAMPSVPASPSARPRRRPSTTAARFVAGLVAALVVVLGGGPAVAAPDAAPGVTGIVRVGGSGPTNAGTVAFSVTFSEEVTGLDAGDFVLTGTGTARGVVTSVSGTGSTYLVVVTECAGDGTLRLDLRAGGVVTSAGSVPVPGYAAGQVHVLDHTAPAAPALALHPASDSGASSADQVTAVTTPTFTGSAEPGATVELLDGVTVLGATTATGGLWSLTSTRLADGPHAVTARAVDAAGNLSPQSTPLVVTVDTRAPEPPVLTSPAATASPQPVLAGTAEPGSTVTVSVGGADYVTSAGTGAWSVDLATAAPVAGVLALDRAGANTVRVRATDLAGNVSPPGTQELVVDTTPVVASVQVPADGAYAAGTVLGFAVSFTGPVVVDTSGGTPTLPVHVGSATVEAPYVAGSGTSALVFHLVVTPGMLDADGIALGSGLRLQGGTLRGTDGGSVPLALAGVPSLVGVLVDTVAPPAPAAALARDTGADPADGVTRDGEVAVAGLEAGAAWRWSADAGRTWTAGSGSAFVLPPGTYAAGDVRVRQVDAAGNTGAAVVLGAVVVDTTPPGAPVLGADRVRATAGARAVVGTLTSADADGPPRLALVAGAGDADNALFAVEGGALVLLDPAGAGVGPRSVRVAAVDLAGNASAAVLVVHVVADPAPVLTAQPADRLDVVLGGTARFEVRVADPSTLASVRWQVTTSAPAGSATPWQPAGDGTTLAVTARTDAWYRAVLVGTDGSVTVSDTARLTLWDVATQVGADHGQLAARFPGAADLRTVAPGLRLADLPGTATLTLPWTARDEAVTVYAYSTPRALGTFAVAAGRVTLTDLALEAGEHYLVVVGVDSREVTVLHYDTAVPAPGAGAPVRAAGAGAAPAPARGNLAVTGTSTTALAGWAGTALAAGTLLLVGAHRRRARAVLAHPRAAHR